MAKFAPGTSTYTAPHQSDSCGGKEHIDVYRTDEKGHYTKEHSTDSSDIKAGGFLSAAMSLFRGGRDD